MPRKRQAPIERFERSIMPEPNSGCWLWVANINSRYPRFWDGDQVVKGHRWSYEHFIGPIRDGLQIDHLCCQKLCVNPAHLEPVTCRENVQRGFKSRMPDWSPRLRLPSSHKTVLEMTDIRHRTKALGMSMAELCRRARIARSTPVRWAQGSKPQKDKYRRVISVLDRAERRLEAAE